VVCFVSMMRGCSLAVVVVCIALVCESRRFQVGSIIPTDLFNTKWSYNQTYASKHGLLGPDDWKSAWPLCDPSLPGAKQSPIDIVTDNIPLSNAGVLPLTFTDDSCPSSMRNIGATLSAVPSDPVNCKSSFTTASGTQYKFYEVHFHWNHFYNHRGSEHRVNGQAEAMEAQLVHYNAKFSSIDEAFRDGNPGDIAVVAIRYNVAQSAETTTEVPVLNDLIDPSYSKCEFMDLSKDGVADVGKINAYEFIGTALNRKNLPMFHYNGSLTVPSCDSVVSWYIVQQTVMLSKSQIQQLRCYKHVNKSAYDDKSLGFEIDSNVRPVFPLGDREVVAWPDIVPTNESSDSGPDSQLVISSSDEPFFTTGTIIGLSAAGGVLLIGIIVIIVVLVCRESPRSGYEGINSA